MGNNNHKIVIVASKNPVKIKSVENGFNELFPELKCETKGVSIPSLVSDQPMDDAETYQGALNRAQGAKEQYPDADYWVGVEGGNIRHDDDMETMAWIIVLSNTQMGRARTAGFFLPPAVVDLINKGYELGHADDIVFGRENSKQGSGACGLLTNGVIDRLRLYVPAVVMAFIPFRKPALYE